MDDYDEAIRFYVENLNFTLLENTVQSETKLRIKVAPNGFEECCLLLAKAVGGEQRSCTGNQTGGRVFLFLKTDDFWRDYKNMQSKGINFVREPKTEEYGTVAVFEDFYGDP